MSHLKTILIASGVLVATYVLGDYWKAIPADVEATFVGRDSCVNCHREQADLFVGSHHDLAMDIATEDTVLGDFSDVVFEHDGLQNRLYRDGEKFMVHTEGEDGTMRDFEVKYVFGVDPLQQYMVEFDRDPDAKKDQIGRLQVLRISWDTHAKKWFYLRPPDVLEKLEPGDPLHWTGPAQRWQTMCADCHSTNLKRNFDVESLNYRTTFSEIDVSCEACHGPGSLHVQFAESKSLFWDRNHGYGLAKLKGDDTTRQLESCAPCHSRRGLLDESFTANDSYHDFFNLELLRSATYHDDGQIKDEVYEFGSFTQSKMYHKGIRCTDCHDPHSLKLKHPGNATCTSCHQHAAGKYDVPSHHHHPVGSEGAMCVNCHMPHTTYMAVDARRDHSLRVPRPDLSVKLKTPNACSGCHVKDQIANLPKEKTGSLNLYQDWIALRDSDPVIADAVAKTDQWCDEACNQWYGSNRQTPEHYAEVLYGMRNGDQSAFTRALGFVTKPPADFTPVIARATALDEMILAGDRLAIKAADTILSSNDESPLLRATAVRAYLLGDPSLAAKRLAPLMNDPSRLVRSESARTLVQGGGYQSVSGTSRKAVDAVLNEVHRELDASADRGGAHMSWAMLCELRGDYIAAVASYETAIRVEPNAAGPRSNLAELLDQIENAANSGQPGVSELARNLVAERGVESMSRWTRDLRGEELLLLARDADLAPDIGEVQYRYGLALYLAGRLEEAESRLQRAVDLAPDVEIFQTALRLLQEKIHQDK